MPDAKLFPGPALALVALCACQALQENTGAAGGTPREEGPAVATVDVATVGEGDTFAYLLSRYDANDDETITAAEYTRHDVQLSRWDTNADGVLTEVDFEVAEPTLEEIGELRKARAAGRYFQDDDEHEVLRAQELAGAFAAYEGPGGDGELTQGEFTARAEARRVALPGDDSLMMQNYTFGDPWQALLRGFDEDGSGSIGLWELGVYVEGQGPDGLRFDRDRCDGGTPGATFTRIDYLTALEEGDEVPALQLERLHDEGTVRLSQFAGKVPVALIFGSYT